MRIWSWLHEDWFAERLSRKRDSCRMPMKWYVVHTYSGHENKAQAVAQERVKQAG